MASQELNPVDTVLALIRNHQHFILQGGAGSGKTESLKEVVRRLAESDRSFKIACITHTNKAADEIRGRVEANVTVSTIHSFLASLIAPYERNIQLVFPKLFLLPPFRAVGVEAYAGDDREWKKEEHSRFKAAHKSLSDRRKIVLKEYTPKVSGKRDYDKNPSHFNDELNSQIEEVNASISDQLKLRSPKEFLYNDTIFDNFHDPSFGHDGLIKIACHLFDTYPLLGKIIADRYDGIFIDEYQDTNADVIRVLLRSPPANKVIVGLFGDSEQAIYQDGIGSARLHIDSEELVLVEKKDNYRCSPQVIKVSNQFRTDGLTQEIALKTLDDGTLETIESRQGQAIFYYAIEPYGVESDASTEDKESHAQACAMARDRLVEKVTNEHPEYVQLKLTNKSIAKDVGFGELYDVFDKRYREARERMKKTLDRLQFGEIAELVQLYHSLTGDRRAFNRLISKLRKRHFSIQSVRDKEKVEGHLKSLSSEERGAYETVQFAVHHGLIKQSDSHRSFLERRRATLERLDDDAVFKEFEELHERGANTLLRMKKALSEAVVKNLTEEVLDESFDDMDRDRKEKLFFEELFSSSLQFAEIVAYYRYEHNDSNFATIHKTKGTGIDNVMIILDEYGWSEYDFLSCFSGELPEGRREVASRKLLYVACSRAKQNLICVRLVRNEAEARKIAQYFPEAIPVDLN